jgi:hypothetical protein
LRRSARRRDTDTATERISGATAGDRCNIRWISNRLVSLGHKKMPNEALFVYKELRSYAWIKSLLSPSFAKSLSCTPAAERMRRHRQRRHDGLRCLIIELRETEIDALIRKGLLKPEMHNDTIAIIDALYAHLESTLDQPL